MELTSKQKKQLKSLAHHLEPVVRVGKKSLSEGVLQEIDNTLEKLELIKVRMSDAEGSERREFASTFAKQTGAGLVQIIGKNAVLFRPSKKTPKIKLVGESAKA